MEQKRLLITGCGRSGTLYAAQVWRALGLDIRHERPVLPNGVMGDDGIASWFMAAEDPAPPSGPSARDYRFDVVIQQVRHPLKVIASMAQFILRDGKRAPGYIARNVPETCLNPDETAHFDSRQQLILRASRYWYHWNLLAEKKADRTVRVENMGAELRGLCDLVGVAYRPRVLEGISPRVNARHLHVHDAPWVVGWDEIQMLDAALAQRIAELAAHYGYPV